MAKSSPKKTKTAGSRAKRTTKPRSKSKAVQPEILEAKAGVRSSKSEDAPDNDLDNRLNSVSETELDSTFDSPFSATGLSNDDPSDDAFDSSVFDREVGKIEIDPDAEIDVADVKAVASKSSSRRRSVTAEIVEPIATRAESSEDTDSSDDGESPKVVSSSKALATADPIAVYLSEIRRYPLLTKEQEQELAIRYRETGDPKAAELLVTSNLRFVVKVAAEYSRFGAKLIDLIQEGNVGLMHAVREFNPYKGVRLITYAVWWIRGYIQEYLMRQYSMVRIGTTQNQRKLFYRLQKERAALEAMGKESTAALLAGRLGVTEEEVETMQKRMSGRDISLSQPIDGGSSTATRLDFEASDETAIDEKIGHREELQLLHENIEKIRPQLNEKETYILENRLLSDDPMTLQEIGDHYGVTRESVRQVEARLINRIRAAITEVLSDPD